MLASYLLSIPHKEISTAAWIALILLVLFIVILNFSLISAFRKKDSSNSQVLHRFMTSIKDPDHPDDTMRQELSERIKRLKNDNPPPKEQ